MTGDKDPCLHRPAARLDVPQRFRFVPRSAAHLAAEADVRTHAEVARSADDALRALVAARDGGPPLMTFRGDVRCRVPLGRYRYPDVMLTTRPPQAPDDEHDVVLNPLVIVEVLSESTEHVDRGPKLREYRTIPSLKDYVLLAQNTPIADHYTRVGGGADHPDEPDAWRVMTYEGNDAAVPLAGLGNFKLGAVYGG